MVELEQNRRMVVEVLDVLVPARIVLGFTFTEDGTRLAGPASSEHADYWRRPDYLVVCFYRLTFEKDLRYASRRWVDRGEL
jgi:hypothetical protein